MSLLTCLRKEWIELSRTSRLLVLLIVLGFFGLSSPLLAKYTPEMMTLIPGGEAIASIIPVPSLVDAITQYVKNIGQFGILLALLLSMGLVSREKERGTAALLLTKPLPRRSFLWAKFIALGLGFGLALLVASLGGYYYTRLLFGSVALGGWLLLSGALFIQVLLVSAVTLLFSTLLRSQAAAAGLALGLTLLVSLLESIPGLAPYLPNRLVAWAANNLLGGPPLAAWPALAICLGLMLACLLAAWQIFERQEL
jgi:ABC-2 type transport system permease protein